MTAEPLTPPQIELKLRQIFADLDRAQTALAVARDTEVAARHEYLRAKRKAMLSGECPKVARGGWTTSERDSWVEQQCEDLELEAVKAEAFRAAAADHLKVLYTQAEIARSLSASVRASLGLAGAIG
jgi:hypothetical protein